MYDKALEQLIDAVIADGVITDQERKVVYKKAATLGIDQDEIEVYLEGRLVAFKDNLNPTSRKQGIVKTCPNCGAVVKSGSATCSECGYFFQGTQSNSSTERLFKMLKDKSFEKQSHIVRAFPIPNNREDLFEFLSYLEGSAFRIKEADDGNYERDFCTACHTKYIECLNKAKISFPDDNATKMFEEHYKNNKKNNIKNKIGKGCVYAFLVWVILCFLFLILIF